jgi:DNA invertase Pin-like site-specific DNA recombinase
MTTRAAVWLRVSPGHQDSDNQVPDVERFAAHHGYEIAGRYVVSDSAWKNGGGAEYRKALRQALDDAHAGKFSVLIVWALDRIAVTTRAAPRRRCGSSANSASAAAPWSA